MRYLDIPGDGLHFGPTGGELVSDDLFPLLVNLGPTPAPAETFTTFEQASVPLPTGVDLTQVTVWLRPENKIWMWMPQVAWLFGKLRPPKQISSST